jgi:hypothetical protein
MGMERISRPAALRSFFGGGVDTTALKSSPKTRACVSNDAPAALPLLPDFSTRAKWIGAPFADEGKKPSAAINCLKFSRTRRCQDSLEEGRELKLRRNGSRIERTSARASGLRRTPGGGVRQMRSENRSPWQWVAC